MKIFLDSEHHYWVDGQRYDGVTDVLRSEGFMSDYIPADMDFYLLRGSMIHKATELWDLGILDESTVDERIRNYIESWKKLGLKYPKEAIERKLIDPVYRYAGTLDRWDCDLKSGCPEPWHIFQVAAYSGLAKTNGLPLTPNKTIYLQEDGSLPKIVTYHPMDLRSALQTFLCALRVYRAKKEM